MFAALKFTAKTLKGIISADNHSISKMPHYAVAIGKTVGIYSSWAECEKQVKGFTGAKFKKFSTPSEAKTFISENGSNQSSVITQSYKTFSNQRNYSHKTLPRIEIPNTIQVSDDEDSIRIDDELNKIMDRVEKPKSVSASKSIRKTIMLDSLPNLKRSRDDSSSDSSKRIKTDNAFDINSEGFTVVYTDGSCTSNGTKRAKAGLGVYFGENHPLNTSEPVSGRATNNCGEIQAATKAITLANSAGIKKLAIKTDSQFVINAVTKWLPGWKRKGWKLASGEPVKNEVDFKELDKALKLMEIKWVYVKAHEGILGNECADQLAKQGAEMYDKR